MAPQATLSRSRHRSAFEDGRFTPLERHELVDIEVGVSLLVDFESARSPSDWVVGVHGVQIAFDVDGRTYSATYLPEVAAEQGWDHSTAIDSLVRKAGYRGALPVSARTAMRVTRYKSSKATLSYEQWVSARGSAPRGRV